MVRAPCCEKLGLNKGPWTQQEDQILISYIQKHGHSNWRALPTLAGLLRCGKSCRLRWINYLKPDIKRGNFSREEEEIIINLHEILGNKWSTIAAKLPGRTDNEIKNVWHTYLKKRLRSKNEPSKEQCATLTKLESNPSISNEQEPKLLETNSSNNVSSLPMSPQQSSSEYSSVSDTSITSTETSENNNGMIDKIDESEIFPMIDENFWAPGPELDQHCIIEPSFLDESQFQMFGDFMEFRGHGCTPNFDDGMEFWYDLFVKAEGVEELL